jgi:hypothetical protein
LKTEEAAFRLLLYVVGTAAVVIVISLIVKSL